MTVAFSPSTYQADDEALPMELVGPTLVFEGWAPENEGPVHYLLASKQIFTVVIQ